MSLRRRPVARKTWLAGALGGSSTTLTQRPRAVFQPGRSQQHHPTRRLEAAILRIRFRHPDKPIP